MEVFILWVLFGIFSAALANGKNRSVGGWFLVGLLFGPFGLLVGFFSKIQDARELDLELLEKLKLVTDLKEAGTITESQFKAGKDELMKDYGATPGGTRKGTVSGAMAMLTFLLLMLVLVIYWNSIY